VAKLTPEQKARWALKWGVRREHLTQAVQLEYDRLKPYWEAAGVREYRVGARAQVRAGQAEYDRVRQDLLRERLGATPSEPVPVVGGDRPAIRSGSYAPPLNGEQVRATRFLSAFASGGYDRSEVDDLLGRLAAELDAGRPVAPLIRGARLSQRQTLLLRRVAKAYDVAAVDWFLEELLRREGHPEPPGASTDPWRDLPVVNMFTWPGSGDQPGRSRSLVEQAGQVDHADAERFFSGECANAWRDFGQPRGLQLWWRGGEVRTVDQQAIASQGGPWTTTVSVGGRSFTLKGMRRKRYLALGLPQIAGRQAMTETGHFGTQASHRTQQALQDKGWLAGAGLKELVDEAGTPILYIAGRNFHYRADAGITFADGRWLQFPVRGTELANAIMTAVDQAGNKVARYRAGELGGRFSAATMEITVHPGQPLTDELVLAIAISAPWLTGYFATSS
jgi:DivIVA domain-containing protein